MKGEVIWEASNSFQRAVWTNKRKRETEREKSISVLSSKATFTLLITYVHIHLMRACQAIVEVLTKSKQKYNVLT